MTKQLNARPAMKFSLRAEVVCVVTPTKLLLTHDELRSSDIAKLSPHYCIDLTAVTALACDEPFHAVSQVNVDFSRKRNFFIPMF